jgi:hypothetical protein
MKLCQAVFPKSGPSCFAQARDTERTLARAARRAAGADALAALHAAREAFADHAAEAYAGGAEAALRDCDLLEQIADELVLAIERLEPAFARLDVARDLAFYRGPTLSRVRSRYDMARLAGLAAEVLAEDMLSGTAGAVLSAAVRRRCSG